MKTVFATVVSITAVAFGWVAVSSFKASGIESPPEAVYHPAFDPGRIDREIAFHEARVKRDPKGAIGWAMLSAAYLAKGREFDSDVSAWMAEEAARKSLDLRSEGNLDGAKRLIQSLLEQHRFQDALGEIRNLSALKEGLGKLEADVLIELGKTDQAQAIVLALDASDPARHTLLGRVASVRGEHREAARHYMNALAILGDIRDVLAEDLAWYEVKIGEALREAGDCAEARKHLEEALALHPRSYKAKLGMARVAMDTKDYAGVNRWVAEVLETSSSLEAMVLAAEAERERADTIGWNRWKERLYEQFRSEDAELTKLGRGGPLKVRHGDRTFASFCARYGLYLEDGLRAAKRDFANRPDKQAKWNLDRLSVLLQS